MNSPFPLRKALGGLGMQAISSVVDRVGPEEATGGEGGEAVASAWLPVQVCSPEPNGIQAPGPRPISVIGDGAILSAKAD